REPYDHHHGGDADPQDELREAHHGHAHDLAHHQLEGLHAADQHLHDAVLLLLHDAAHHLHAVHEDEYEHEVAEEEADDGPFLREGFLIDVLDVERLDVKRLAHALESLRVDVGLLEPRELDALIELP